MEREREIIDIKQIRFQKGPNHPRGWGGQTGSPPVLLTHPRWCEWGPGHTI